MTTSSPVIESIDRALLVLNFLAQSGPQGATLADISEELNINKSTVFRAVSTLKARNFIAQEPKSGKYMLGTTAISMGQVFFSNLNFPVLLHPALEKISSETNELVHLGVPHGVNMTYVDKVSPQNRTLQVWSVIGQSVPMAWSALGRAYLAYSKSDLDDLSTYISEGALYRKNKAPSPLTDKELKEILITAKKRGFSTEIEENEPGIACIGLPIVCMGNAIAAVSITRPATGADDTLIRSLAQSMHDILVPQLPEGFSLPELS